MSMKSIGFTWHQAVIQWTCPACAELVEASLRSLSRCPARAEPVEASLPKDCRRVEGAPRPTKDLLQHRIVPTRIARVDT